MPGDPLRAKFIAEHYLENAVCYNTVRGMYGYTGTYAGIPVSIQGSGMGMPSIGIYSYELYHMYGVKQVSASALPAALPITSICGTLFWDRLPAPIPTMPPSTICPVPMPPLLPFLCWKRPRRLPGNCICRFMWEISCLQMYSTRSLVRCRSGLLWAFWQQKWNPLPST